MYVIGIGTFVVAMITGVSVGSYIVKGETIPPGEKVTQKDQGDQHDVRDWHCSGGGWDNYRSKCRYLYSKKINEGLNEPGSYSGDRVCFISVYFFFNSDPTVNRFSNLIGDPGEVCFFQRNEQSFSLW